MLALFTFRVILIIVPCISPLVDLHPTSTQIFRISIEKEFIYLNSICASILPPRLIWGGAVGEAV